MSYRCGSCNAEYHHPNTAILCADSHKREAGMRFEVSCSTRECYLHRTPLLYGDALPAESLAGAHEARFKEDPDGAHYCDVKDLLVVPSSENPEAATGDKGGGHG